MGSQNPFVHSQLTEVRAGGSKPACPRTQVVHPHYGRRRAVQIQAPSPSEILVELWRYRDSRSDSLVIQAVSDELHFLLSAKKSGQ